MEVRAREAQSAAGQARCRTLEQKRFRRSGTGRQGDQQPGRQQQYDQRPPRPRVPVCRDACGTCRVERFMDIGDGSHGQALSAVEWAGWQSDLPPGPTFPPVTCPGAIRARIQSRNDENPETGLETAGWGARRGVDAAAGPAARRPDAQKGACFLRRPGGADGALPLRKTRCTRARRTPAAVRRKKAPALPGLKCAIVL